MPIQANKKVDFFIVGEPKSGTTALANFLGQHPDIGISYPKEPHYFATDLIEASDKFHGGKSRHFEIRTEKQYQDCFKNCSNKAIWGEGSTHYLTSHKAAENIKRYNKNSKIIILLRDPVDFVYSLHAQYINNGCEDEPNFKLALEKEKIRRQGKEIPKGTRVPSDLFYSDRVKYAEQIKRFYDQFPKDQILVLINEEFKADNAKVFKQVLKFMGADPSFIAEFNPVHEAKKPRSKIIHKAFNNLALKNAVKKAVGPHRYNAVKNVAASVFLKREVRAPLGKATRLSLYNQYGPAIRDTAKLIGRSDLVKLWSEKGGLDKSNKEKPSHART